MHLRAHVETETGRWNGELPACSRETPRRAYVKGEVQLTGVSSLTKDGQRGFREALVQNIGSLCGPHGDSACSETDVTITSVTPRSARRTQSVTVAWSMETTEAAASNLQSAVSTTVQSSTFTSSLASKHASLSQVSAVTVVTAPHIASSSPEVPSNEPINQGAPNPSSSTSKNELGVFTVASQEVDERVSAGDFDVILDVRSAREYAQGHIPGAIHMPSSRAEAIIAALEGCKHAKVGVYCWTGFDRATPMAGRLASRGFTNVYDLGGLQFMDGMVLETGAWDGQLPACAAQDELTIGLFATESDDDSTTTILVCVLIVAGLFLIAGVGWLAMRSRTVANTAEDAAVVPGAATTAYPADQVDLEKAKAQSQLPGTGTMFTACTESRGCGPGEKPVVAMATAETAPVPEK